MSGKLRLKGTTSGFSQLTAPAVAGDQTFTLPETGGIVATVNNSGAANVGGYQTGEWIPNFVSLSSGEINTDETGTTSSSGDYKAKWSRIGNIVTFGGYIKLDGRGNLTGSVALTGMPYMADDGYYSGSVSYWSLNRAITAAGITITGLASGSGGNYCLMRSLTTEATSMGQSQYGSDYTNGNAVIFTLTYMTNDTTWQPINGATVS